MNEKIGSQPPTFPLTGTAKGGEIRRHYFLNRYVIIAPVRGQRPDAYKGGQPHKTETALSPPIETEAAIYEIKDSQGNWLVKVIPNKYSALTLVTNKAFGKQEIVVETPEHNLEFSQLSVEHIQHIFKAYIERSQVLKNIPGIAYVAVFKNDGPRAGATIAHAHSQIVALPLLPPLVEDEAAAADEYRTKHGACPVCDIVAWEASQNQRVVTEDDQFIAICPYAGTAPYGVWLIPKQHTAKFADFSPAQFHSCAALLKMVSKKLDEFGISFNFFIHDSVDGHDHHSVIKVEPRTNVWGGLELSTGVIINDVPPEFAAQWYKSA